MYIYIYCIYISHKKIQHLPPPQRAASVARALSRNCPDDRFWAGFGGVQHRTPPPPPCRAHKPPWLVTSSANKLLSACSPSPGLFFFFPFFFFLFFLLNEWVTKKKEQLDGGQKGRKIIQWDTAHQS